MGPVLLLTIIATIILGAYRIVQKSIGLNIHPILGAIFVYFFGLLTAIAAFFIYRPEIVFGSAFKKGALIAILGGIIIVLGDILMFTIFKKGGSVAIVTPFLSAGSLLLAAVLGILIFRESLNFLQIIGILAIIGGIILLTR